MKRFRPSIYGILIQRGRVLVCESHTAKTSFSNFPGGGIELGEAPLDALRREFIEETGLIIRPKRIVWASTAFHRGHVEPQVQMLGTYWLVQRTGGTLKKQGNGDDVRAVQWATRAQLLKLPFTTFDSEALPAILRELRG